MSMVTSIILTTVAGDEDKLEALNAAWDFDEFEDTATMCAGCKQMQCQVYLGGFNYLDLPA